MPNLTTRILIAVATFVFGIALATVWLLRSARPEPETPERAAARTAQPPTPPAEAAATPVSPIRLVDFSNFVFPGYSFDERGGEGHEAAEPKEGGPSYVSYGDATGDGEEEAMLALGFLTGGSAMPHKVYVYGMRGGRPRLLWRFEDGDRADGGLRRIYAEGGGLVVELYGKRADGKGKIVGGDLYADDGMMTGACCPKYFTRARYSWNGKRFVLRGEPEVLPNPEGHGSLLSPP